MNYKKGTQTRGCMKSVMRYVSQPGKTFWDTICTHFGTFSSRRSCHPQMQLKQDAAKRMAECLIPTRSAEQMVS